MKKSKHLLFYAGLATLLLLATASPFTTANTHGELEQLNKQALDKLKTGQYAQGISMAKKALELIEQDKGADDTDVATILSNLGGLYQGQGEYAQAEPLYQRALAIREKALGVEHPQVATSLENLAVFYHKTSRAELAKPLEKRAAAIRAIKR